MNCRVLWQPWRTCQHLQLPWVSLYPCRHLNRTCPNQWSQESLLGHKNGARKGRVLFGGTLLTSAEISISELYRLSSTLSSLLTFWTRASKSQSARWFRAGGVNGRNSLNVLRFLHECTDQTLSLLFNQLHVSYICRKNRDLLSLCEFIMLSQNSNSILVFFCSDYRLINQLQCLLSYCTGLIRWDFIGIKHKVSLTLSTQQHLMQFGQIK